MRRWFLAHWFAAVFLLVGILWLVTLTAYYFGFSGLRFKNRFTGQDAVIDFMRQYDRPVVGLAEGVGLELENRGSTLGGTVVRLAPAPPVLCWVCGRLSLDGGIAIVQYRDGDWLYRAAEDLTTNSEATHGQLQASRDYILTVAYNRTTHERVIAQPDVASQARALANHGLVAAESARLSPARIADLEPASTLREGCVVFNAAFVAVALLWLVLGGVALVIVRVVRRQRS